MSYSNLIGKSVSILRKNKWIWSMGIAAALFSKAPGIVQNQVATNLLKSINDKDIIFSILGFLSELSLVKAASILSFFLLSMIVALVVLYISRGAMIEMAWLSASNRRPSIIDGLRVGLDRMVSLTAISAFTWFAFMSLLILIGIFLFSPLAFLSGSQKVIPFFLIVFSIFVAAAVIGLVFTGLLVLISSRVCVIKREPVFRSLGQGFAFLRKNIGKTAVIWLIALGFSIGTAISLSILSLPFNIAVGTAFSAKSISSLAITITLMVVAVSVIYGLVEAFFSILWTLFYIEIDSEESKPAVD